MHPSAGSNSYVSHSSCRHLGFALLCVCGVLVCVCGVCVCLCVYVYSVV